MRHGAILYACGDFLNDYEGISGHESFRPELTLMFFPTLDPATGKLLELTLTPMRIHKFRVQRANSEEADWLAVLLRRESAMPVERTPDLRLLIR